MQPSGHVMLSADHDLHIYLSLLSVCYHTGTFGMTASRETFKIYMHDFKYDCARYSALHAMLTRHSVNFGLGQGPGIILKITIMNTAVGSQTPARELRMSRSIGTPILACPCADSLLHQPANTGGNVMHKCLLEHNSSCANVISLKHIGGTRSHIMRQRSNDKEMVKEPVVDQAAP